MEILNSALYTLTVKCVIVNLSMIGNSSQCRISLRFFPDLRGGKMKCVCSWIQIIISHSLFPHIVHVVKSSFASLNSFATTENCFQKESPFHFSPHKCLICISIYVHNHSCWCPHSNESTVNKRVFHISFGTILFVWLLSFFFRMSTFINDMRYYSKVV